MYYRVSNGGTKIRYTSTVTFGSGWNYASDMSKTLNVSSYNVTDNTIIIPQVVSLANGHVSSTGATIAFSNIRATYNSLTNTVTITLYSGFSAFTGNINIRLILIN